ncbi:hypothetical protein DFH07DRAFT_861552 [Mycena maculata]|uniref:Mediator of RNA polymerase II transcription subunit 21 n=1 Tax=Mycena maculata TaxID=230809 RepID=A0AAD7HCL1_9AGAR|nr:hypothetical protein DFH07DRAFT_861552 [Mycena maculata]
MLQELSHMDRITQLPDGTQQLPHHHVSHDHLPRAPISSKLAQTFLTKERNPEKYDTPDVFEVNKKELVTDVIVKAKQVEYLIKSLPEPEREEEQAKRLRALDEEMTVANDAYIQAVARSKDLHVQITDVLRLIPETDTGLVDMLH